ncbi:BREX-1 system phosphatase PglZ type A [Haloferula sp.]|uniref:BREX-1 system phosphatase PglZ type A n=1 Tax=Haloferula sp. TaxID=2497595 RepID=UPI00329DE33E
MDPIEKGIVGLFERHRIVFWYDAAAGWKTECAKLDLEGVTKLHVANNELGVKLRIIRDEPDEKFLLYFASSRPLDEENWLLDVLLAQGEFHADRASLNLQQIGLPPEFKELIKEHQAFFTRKDRRKALTARIQADDSHRMVRRRMIAIVVGAADDSLDSILLVLSGKLVKELLDPVSQGLAEFGLDGHFWDDLERQFGYRSSSPSLKDFMLEVFRFNAPIGPGEKPALGGQAVLFMSRWKDSSSHRPSFEELSSEFAQDLDIASALNAEQEIGELIEMEIDAYELVEQRVVHWIRDKIVDGSLKPDRRRGFLEKRTRSVWYPKYESLYQALDHAGELLTLISDIDVDASSIEEATRFYTHRWWRIDYHYRRFHENRRAANQAGLLAPVELAVEGSYSNGYLVPLATRWESLMDTESTWPPKGVSAQAGFFDQVVKPVLKSGQKLFVIISDALRYECSAELRQRLLREDRYQAELGVRAGSLPSFTQLGIASLLPHKTLELAADGKSVAADGRSTVGSAARLKILQENAGVNACLYKAEDFLKLSSKTEGRPLMKEHELFYIYHNAIDAAGDDLKSEETVASACAEALDTLVAVIKKVAAINGTNMVVTSDHGFLFQQSQIDDADCPKLPAGELSAIARRYVLGKGIKTDHVLRQFSSSDLQLEGDLEIGIVKGVQRLPLKGSGKRFVHGGAMPQEVLIPVLTVNKTRASDIRTVNVEIQSFPARITTSQVAVRLYQAEPVSEGGKVIERELQVGLYTKDGEPLSDEQWANFESTEEDPRLRESTFSLTLGHKAESFNGGDVYLRLREKIRNTNKMRTYQEAISRLERHFGSDFDDF